MTSIDLEGTSRLAIRQVLAQRAGEDADSRAVADAAIRLWYQVASCLTPVIGVDSFEVLFRHALHLSWSGAHGLAVEPAREPCAAPRLSFRASLERCDPATALERCCSLLFSFNTAAASLIGAPLLARLLGRLWEPSSCPPS